MCIYKVVYHQNIKHTHTHTSDEFLMEMIIIFLLGNPEIIYLSITRAFIMRTCKKSCKKHFAFLMTYLTRWLIDKINCLAIGKPINYFVI